MLSRDREGPTVGTAQLARGRQGEVTRSSKSQEGSETRYRHTGGVALKAGSQRCACGEVRAQGRTQRDRGRVVPCRAMQGMGCSRPSLTTAPGHLGQRRHQLRGSKGADASQRSPVLDCCAD